MLTGRVTLPEDQEDREKLRPGVETVFVLGGLIRQRLGVVTHQRVERMTARSSTLLDRV